MTLTGSRLDIKSNEISRLFEYKIYILHIWDFQSVTLTHKRFLSNDLLKSWQFCCSFDTFYWISLHYIIVLPVGLFPSWPLFYGGGGLAENRPLSAAAAWCICHACDLMWRPRGACFTDTEPSSDLFSPRWLGHSSWTSKCFAGSGLLSNRNIFMLLILFYYQLKALHCKSLQDTSVCLPTTKISTLQTVNNYLLVAYLSLVLRLRFCHQWDVSAVEVRLTWRSMVKHQPLQVYERQLCLSCITGIYGCRWKRYQRSHDDTTKVRRKRAAPLKRNASQMQLPGKNWLCSIKNRDFSWRDYFQECLAEQSENNLSKCLIANAVKAP